MNCVDLVQEIIEASKKKTGIYFIDYQGKEKFVRYSEIFTQAKRIAAYLKQQKIQSKSEIVLQINTPEKFIYTFWGCVIGGYIAIPCIVGINDDYRKRIAHIWRKLDNPYVIAEDESILTNIEKNQLSEQYKETLGKIRDKTFCYQEILSQEIVYDELLFTNMSYENEITLIQFSSGSTGVPKGVILTHSNLVTNVKSMIKAIELDEKDIGLTWLPLTHDMGLIGGHLIPLMSGISSYMMPTDLFIKNPIMFLEKLSEHKITLTLCPNFGYKYILESLKRNGEIDIDLSSIRLIFNGSEPISYNLCEKFLKTMDRFGLHQKAIYPVYGMAEAGLGVTFPKANEGVIPVSVNRQQLIIGEAVEKNPVSKEAVFVSVGYPIEECFVRICDRENNILDDEKLGIIQIKGKNVTLGYYHNEEATRELYIDDEWINTGDLGFITEGRLVITGRDKEIIFINGKNYFPCDIETAIRERINIPIDTIIATGIFDTEKQKEMMCIFVVSNESLEKFVILANQIKEIVFQQIGIPVEYVIPIEDVPLTESGKVKRFELNDKFCKREFDEIITKLDRYEQTIKPVEKVEQSYGQTVETIINICEQIFEGKHISVNDNFTNYGANSLLITRFYEEIDKVWPGKIEISDLYSYSNILKLAEYIDSVLEKKDKLKCRNQNLNEQDMQVIEAYCQSQSLVMQDMLETLFLIALSETENNSSLIRVSEDINFMPQIDFASMEELEEGVREFTKQKNSVLQGNNISHENKEYINLSKVLICEETLSKNIVEELLKTYDYIVEIVIDETICFRVKYINNLQEESISKVMDVYSDILQEVVNESKNLLTQ